LEKIVIGDMVRLKESSQVGSVVKLSKNKATVEFDHIKTEVDVIRLEKLEHKKAVKAKVKLL
jgi:dsDNA-specific endonuclease/ATPase MutS2